MSTYTHHGQHGYEYGQGKFVTRDDLVEYVKARLGFPVLELELEMEEKNGLGHIYLAINDSVDWMWRHAQDEANYMDYMVLPLRQGIMEYDLPPEVSDVIDVAPSFGNGFTPWTAFDVGSNESLVATTGWSQFDLVTYTGAMRYISDVQKLVGLQYKVIFNPNQHKLKIYPTPKAERVAMVRVYMKAKMSDIFNMINFRDLVVARTKIMWGEILDRDDYTFPGGGKVNGGRLLENARSDLDKMEQRIMDEGGQPYILTDLDM